MSEAPERIWGGVYTSEITTYKPFHSAVGYVREDLYEAAMAENARLREAQLAAEAKLADAEAKLAKAVEALESLADCVDDGCFCSEIQMAAAMDAARTTLAELTGGKDE